MLTIFHPSWHYRMHVLQNLFADPVYLLLLFLPILIDCYKDQVGKNVKLFHIIIAAMKDDIADMRAGVAQIQGETSKRREARLSLQEMLDEPSIEEDEEDEEDEDEEGEGEGGNKREGGEQEKEEAPRTKKKTSFRTALAICKVYLKATETNEETNWEDIKEGLAQEQLANCFYTEERWVAVISLVREWIGTGARGTTKTFLAERWKRETRINYGRCQELMQDIAFA